MELTVQENQLLETFTIYGQAKGTALTVCVSKGDIFLESAVDTLLTVTNIKRNRCGSMDMELIRHSGSLVYDQLDALPSSFLHDGLAVAFETQPAPSFPFRRVIFLFDEHGYPLHELVYHGLCEALCTGSKTIALPLLRTGISSEEKDQDLSPELLRGIVRFIGDYPQNSLERLVFVGNKDSATLRNFTLDRLFR